MKLFYYLVAMFICIFFVVLILVHVFVYWRTRNLDETLSLLSPGHGLDADYGGDSYRWLRIPKSVLKMAYYLMLISAVFLFLIELIMSLTRR